jgi:hypothetical protein
MPKKMPRRNITTIPDTIPSELQREILGYVHPKHARNCGEFFSMLSGRNKVQQIQRNPSLLKYFKKFVLYSLGEFHRRLLRTKVIQFCSAGPKRARMIIVRVKEALKFAKKSNDAQELMEHCKMIATWKQECRKIQERLSHVATRLPLGRLAKKDYKGLYVRAGNSQVHRSQSLSASYWARYVPEMLACISHDAKELPYLTSATRIWPFMLEKIRK